MAADYLGTETKVWHQTNRCLGCPVQTQGLYGMAGSVERMPELI